MPLRCTGPDSGAAGFCRVKQSCEGEQSVEGPSHFMHLPVLQISGDNARGRLHFQWLGLYNAGSNLHGQRRAAGYYDVTYRRMNGSWLIQHRLEKTVASVQSEGYDVYINAHVAPRYDGTSTG